MAGHSRHPKATSSSPTKHQTRAGDQPHLIHHHDALLRGADHAVVKGLQCSRQGCMGGEVVEQRGQIRAAACMRTP